MSFMDFKLDFNIFSVLNIYANTFLKIIKNNATILNSFPITATRYALKNFIFIKILTETNR